MNSENLSRIIATRHKEWLLEHDDKTQIPVFSTAQCNVKCVMELRCVNAL